VRSGNSRSRRRDDYLASQSPDGSPDCPVFEAIGFANRPGQGNFITKSEKFNPEILADCAERATRREIQPEKNSHDFL